MSFFISVKRGILVTLILLIATLDAKAQAYYLYVALESEDEVSLIRFDAETKVGEIVNTTRVGVYPTENEGPHGLTVSPNGKHWFVSIAHGTPYGQLWKYTTEENKLVGKTELGMFPASMEISTKTGLLYVVNFNLHGDMEPSTLSVVDPETMTRITDIETGIMPHGTRITDDGSYAYHVSMMTDELMEVNTVSMEISRRLHLSKSSGPQSMGMNMNEQHGHASPQCKPTWADPHPEKPFVYVACNGSDTIVEINTLNWEVTRRFKAGQGPYNLEVSHDGALLVASYKGEGATGVFDLNSGKEIGKIENSRAVSHGVAISPDNKYAFISIEGIGGEAGSVDVIDLTRLNQAEVIETGKQAGGIIFWRMID
jgi:DNA-binding beta-propeller fold protein YncE